MTGSVGPLAGLTVLRPGYFDPHYARNRIVAKALRRAGADVIDADRLTGVAQRAGFVTRAVRNSSSDVLLVPFPGHGDVPLVRLARTLRRRGRSAPIVFDPLVSLYETTVTDRGRVAPGTARARRLAFEDRLACRLADLVLIDTNAHRDYFVEVLGADPGRFRRVWLGADDDVMRPAPRVADGTFRALFYGTFVPLQGIEHIVDAARLVEARAPGFELVVVGEGQTYPAVRARARDVGLRNVSFLESRPYEELPALMARADVCLGIFGTGEKAARVVPNKVFDALAAARPVITADTPAAREALDSGRDALLVPVGDPEALAEALLDLGADPDRRADLAAAGHARYQAEFSLGATSRRLAEVLLDLLGGRPAR